MAREFGATGFELDPSYDPERIESANSTERELYVQDSPSNQIFEYADGLSKISFILCADYTPRQINPYRFDSKRLSLEPIAKVIEDEIKRWFRQQNILVRGIQSGHLGLNTYALAKKIVLRGDDGACENRHHYDDSYDFHAKQVTAGSDGYILELLRAFHEFKPKCDELPLSPVDIFMIFDINSYDAVQYLHPRHRVMSNDRYRLKPNYSRQDALLGVIVLDHE